MIKVTEDMLEGMRVNFLHGTLGYTHVSCVFYPPQMLHTFLTSRDYSQDFDAILLAKPTRLNVQSLSMYEDHVAKVISQKLASDTTDTNVEAEDAEDPSCVC